MKYRDKNERRVKKRRKDILKINQSIEKEGDS